MSNIIAVCDRQSEYAHRLMEFMNRKSSFFMKAAAFSNEGSVEEYSNKNKIDLLLISEGMFSEKTARIKAGRKMVLRESPGFASESEPKNIYKYQSAESIVREVMSSYEAERLVIDGSECWCGQKSVIGVYAPYPSARKTSFAIALGQVMARQSPTLYMNLECFSALDKTIGLSCEADLGSLLYLARACEGTAIAKLPMMTVCVQDLDIIPPVHTPEDLTDIDAATWIRLFSLLLSKTGYETLILDFGNEVRDISKIAGFCSSVYIPTRDDPVEEARLEEFRAYLKEQGVGEEKLRQVRLPFCKAGELGRSYCENLIWGELGDYVRGLVQRENIVEQQRNYA